MVTARAHTIVLQLHVIICIEPSIIAVIRVRRVLRYKK